MILGLMYIFGSAPTKSFNLVGAYRHTHTHITNQAVQKRSGGYIHDVSFLFSIYIYIHCVYPLILTTIGFVFRFDVGKFFLTPNKGQKSQQELNSKFETNGFCDLPCYTMKICVGQHLAPSTANFSFIFQTYRQCLSL